MLKALSAFAVLMGIAGPSEAGDIISVDMSLSPPSVIDGDTFKIMPVGGSAVKIRLHGADAPEKGQRCVEAGGHEWDCSAAASEHLRSFLGSGTLECVQVDTSYDRIVAVCYVDGVDVAAYMIRDGLAFHAAAHTSGSYEDVLSAFEKEARDDERGVWDGSAMKPWDWRNRKRR